MDIQKRIRMALVYAGMNQSKLAEALGTSKQSLYNKLNAGKFSVEELEKIAGAMGATYISYFEFPDGPKV